MDRLKVERDYCSDPDIKRRVYMSASEYRDPVLDEVFSMQLRSFEKRFGTPGFDQFSGFASYFKFCADCERLNHACKNG